MPKCADLKDAMDRAKKAMDEASKANTALMEREIKAEDEVSRLTAEVTRLDDERRELPSTDSLDADQRALDDAVEDRDRLQERFARTVQTLGDLEQDLVAARAERDLAREELDGLDREEYPVLWEAARLNYERSERVVAETTPRRDRAREDALDARGDLEREQERVHALEQSVQRLREIRERSELLGREGERVNRELQSAAEDQRRAQEEAKPARDAVEKADDAWLKAHDEWAAHGCATGGG